MKYNKAYFVAKFTAIPDELWIVREFVVENRKCAYGHCGVVHGGELFRLEEANGLREVLSYYRVNLARSDAGVAAINDGECSLFQQSTPKARILAALNELPD